MYYDTCDMIILEILLCDDEMLWYYSAESFEKKLIVHVLD